MGMASRRKWTKRAETLKKMRATDRTLGGTWSEEYASKFRRPGKLYLALNALHG